MADAAAEGLGVEGGVDIALGFDRQDRALWAQLDGAG